MKTAVLYNLLMKWIMELFVLVRFVQELIEYHKAEFGIIDGYYYNEGRNNTINNVIKDLYDLRKEFKTR